MKEGVNMTTIEITKYCSLCNKEETFRILEEYKDCQRCVSSAHGPEHDECRLHKTIHCTADACF